MAFNAHGALQIAGEHRFRGRAAQIFRVAAQIGIAGLHMHGPARVAGFQAVAVRNGAVYGLAV